MDKRRSIILDAVKGVAIIAVALYHFGGGILPYGYLGVDIFFVVGGYLLVKSLRKGLESGSFNYWTFLFRKIVRLWPLILIAGIVTIAAGFMLMLPDDYENVAESIIAAIVFAENVLQCITTKNYWDVVNIYKPLMHLWYIGVLMQAYVFLPIFYLLADKIIKKNGIKICTIGLTIISFALFLLQFFSSAWKFYYLPFRLFEITIGGLLLYLRPIKTNNIKRAVQLFSGIAIAIMICSRKQVLSGNWMLIITVIATILFIHTSMEISGGKVIIALGKIGERSYSIYIWHQVIIAFLLYSFFQHATIKCFFTFMFSTIIISALSYQFVETPLGKVIGKKKQEVKIIWFSSAIAAILLLFSFFIYRNAGVVRDVPELGITTNNVHKNMHAEYCDRPYSWDSEFADDSPKILVIGNSFGRDWANILYEYDETLNISYKKYSDDVMPSIKDRIEAADMVFYAVHGVTGVPDSILEFVPREKLYIVGNKNYGESNGIIYNQRENPDYFNLEVELPNSIIIEDEQLSTLYGDHYISMIAPVRDGTRIKVFTDDKMFISQDCRHLTQAGARYYSRLLDIADLIHRSRNRYSKQTA